MIRAADTPQAQKASGSAAGAVALVLTLVILFSLFRYLHGLAKLLAEAPFIDFAHYYTYTTIVARGLNPFDPQAVAQVDSLLSIRRAGAAANYPPLFYLLMQPWVLLPFRPAAVAWFLASQACLVATVWLCLRRFAAASPVMVTAALFVVLNYQPLIESLALGQTNVLLLFLVALAWWGLRAGSPWIAAGAVAMALHIKVQYGLLIPLLWAGGHHRVANRALLLGSLGFGAGLLLLGPTHHLEYLRYLLSPPDYLYTWSANLSPRATLHRLLAPLPQGPVLATGVTLALDAVLLVLFARAIPRSVRPDSPAADWVWGLGLTAVPLLSPLTEEHHLVVLLLPLILLLLAEPEARMGPRDQVLLLGSILLLGSRYSLEQFPVFQQGALSLLATGKILGVAGLAWCLIRRLRAADGMER
jgi:hypothetical protein